MRVQELVSSLQECRRREAQMKEEKTEGKTDVIGAIMAAIGEMPETLGGQSKSQPRVESVQETLDTLERVEVDIEKEQTIEIMDEDVVCIEETFDSNVTAEKGDLIANESKLNEDELMEEVTNNKDTNKELMEEKTTNNEELSFTAALEQLEELGGLLDFSPL